MLDIVEVVVDSPVDNDWIALEFVLTVVDNVLTLLFVVDRLVDNDAMLLVAALTVLDSTVTALLVDDSPVDNEATPLCAVLIPVDADADNAATELLVVLSWVKLTASVGFVPAATLVSFVGCVALTPPSRSAPVES
nr:hypothetical protein [Burkholderia lata]